jgi:arginine decarboxylase
MTEPPDEVTEPPDDAAAPLLAAWARFVDAPGHSFTIPGHKRSAGAIWPTLGRALAGDVPLFGGVDTIRDAAGALAAAEASGARLWGADWCRYSVGGSTHVNQALALAVGRPGDSVLVARTAHRSTLLGLILAGLEPVWLPTELDDRFGLPIGPSPAVVETTLAAHPEAVAVFLVEPSYVGTIADLSGIADLAHRRGVPLLVDQAWGAHLGFLPGYPRHALDLGADAMVLSAHKTLPAYSQGAVVAARTERLDRGRLDRGVDAGATTSPSGTILASIDASRALLGSEIGRELLGRLQDIVTAARERLRTEPELDGAVVPGPADFAPGRFDPAKLLLLLTGTRRSGVDLERGLIAAGLPVEQANRDTLIPIVTLADDAAAVNLLCDRIAAVATTCTPVAKGTSTGWPAGLGAGAELPPIAVSPRAAFFADHERVDAQAAVGRVSAEIVAPYPPGVAVLVPGEVVTAAALDALRAAADSGVRIAYASDPTLQTWEVLTRQVTTR